MPSVFLISPAAATDWTVTRQLSWCSVYYVVLFELELNSLEEAFARYPREIQAHVARTKQLHEQGSVLMAGALVPRPGERLQTMAVCASRGAAEELAQGDPFVKNGVVSRWSIREWHDMFGDGPPQVG